MTFLVKK